MVLPICSPVPGFHSRTILFPQPIAKVFLSGRNGDACTQRVQTGRGGPFCLCEAVFHRRTSKASVPQANVLPSWLNATVRTWLRQLRETVERCVVVSHSRTVPSWPPLARSLPLGLNATLFTRPSCPRKGWPIGLCVFVFHSCTVWS